MKFTLEWLQSHIETNLSVGEISEKLVSLGIEVEDICDTSKKFDRFVVGRIERCCKHPEADRLSLCNVNIGNSNNLQIVCGAHNVRAGMNVAVALLGSIIPSSGLPLKKGKMRGYDSDGMMCSASELQLEDMEDNGGIIDLGNEDHLIPGTPLSKILGSNEVIFDVSITPNRSDCFSVRGIARLLSASGAGPLKHFVVPEVKETITDAVNVNIQTKDCLYFSCRVVKNIFSVQTPDFIERRLRAIGQKLIHPVVDIANYICLDLGQPMHMFDLNKLDLSKGLSVVNAKGGEILETLDGNKTEIPKGGIIVASGEQPLSVAGIIGGTATSVSYSTKNILIESAYFDKITISLTGQKVRVATDSRTRNERGIDPAGVDIAMNYASYLLGSCDIGSVKKYGLLPKNKRKITVSFEKFKNLSGLSKTQWKLAAKILRTLKFEVISSDDNKMEVITPSFRHDLSIEEDVIEEILILIGYNKINTIELEKKEPITLTYTEEIASDILIYNGYFEVKTFSFIDTNTALLFEENEKNLIKLTDPLTNEFAVMRPSVIGSLLKCLKNNQNKSQKDAKIFELGKKFAIKDKKISEMYMLTILLVGQNTDRTWEKKQRDVSVFDLKRIVEKILSGLGIQRFNVKNSTEVDYYHPGRRGTYTFKKDEPLAFFGEIHPEILSKMDIDGRVACAEIFMDSLPEFHSKKIRGQINMSPYQSIKRDFSFIVGNAVTADKLICAVQKTQIPHLQYVNIFDIYEVNENKKAIGIEVILQSQKETLNDEQIAKISNTIIANVKKSCGATLRGE
ncbi:MAG: phenylalanine--tRNA ligase subunit beta [Holosporales bacterium]|jgi:phenylalanyl-tRNA synthetase beta chain|nr:phenylalanine--tRNA ligase subunit beta [Holosporales bacterium]